MIVTGRKTTQPTQRRKRPTAWGIPVRRDFGTASSSVIQAMRPTKDQLPSSERIDGSSRSAPIMTMKTVIAAETAIPLKNSILMTKRPSSAMITVSAANCTALPEVRTDSNAATADHVRAASPLGIC